MWTRCHTHLILNRCSMSNDPRDLFAKAKGVAATARSTWVHPRMKTGRQLERPDSADESPGNRWGLGALRGRLAELSGRGATATLTIAMELVVEAQQAS